MKSKCNKSCIFINLGRQSNTLFAAISFYFPSQEKCLYGLIMLDNSKLLTLKNYSDDWKYLPFTFFEVFLCLSQRKFWEQQNNYLHEKNPTHNQLKLQQKSVFQELFLFIYAYYFNKSLTVKT